MVVIIYYLCAGDSSSLKPGSSSVAAIVGAVGGTITVIVITAIPVVILCVKMYSNKSQQNQDPKINVVNNFVFHNKSFNASVSDDNEADC